MVFDIYILIPIALLILGIGLVVGWVVSSNIGKNKIASAEDRAKKILDDAEKETNNLKKEKLLEVKDEWYKKKQEFEQESNSRRNKQQAFEKQLTNREDNLERKVELVNKKEKEITNVRRTVDDRLKQLDHNLRRERLRVRYFSID